MPAAGRSIYSNLPYDTKSKCGFMELYALQEWAQFQYSVGPCRAGRAGVPHRTWVTGAGAQV